MLVCKSVIVLVNSPTPVPSVVLLSDVVGSSDVLQHTPRAVTSAPPSAITLPSIVADEDVIKYTSIVATIGRLSPISPVATHEMSSICK